MSWFKVHPAWYNCEIDHLQKSAVYKEKFRYVDNLLVSCGEIIVRQKITKKYPVLFVYPESTPYSPPLVYLLQKILAEEEIIKLSKLNEINISREIKENIKFVYLRHQNIDGSICIIEADNLYKDQPQIYQIKDIIIRIRDWLKSIDTGRIPFDNIEVELFNHFNKRTIELQLLLPEAFFAEDIIRGEFYAVLNPCIPEFTKKIYIGVLIIGQNVASVTLPPKYYANSKHLLFTSVPDPIKLINNIEDFNNNIINETLIEGYWWDIETEPKPFEGVETFVEYIGNGNRDFGYKMIFNSNIFIKLRNYCETIYVGLRFLNRRGKKEWALFRLKKYNNVAFPINPSICELPVMLGNYTIEAIHNEEFTNISYHMRNSKLCDRNVLSKKQVSIIGCGALGSEIADNLGKGGIGLLNLIDNQVLSAHNSIRHILTIDRTGIAKVIGLQFELIMHNPFIDVICMYDNVMQLNINKYICDGGIGISSIADDNTEGYINEQAVINNKTIFYARVLRGGNAARIIRVIPGIDACLNCLSMYNKNNEIFIRIPEDVNLPTITNECNNPVRPASASDIKLIASMTSKIMIDFLQHGDKSKNHWIYSTDPFEGFQYDPLQPFAAKSYFIPPHKDCVYCMKKENIKIKIHKLPLDNMIKNITNSGDLETGGILIGYKDENNIVSLLISTGPGPKAVRKSNWFERDVEYCQRILDEEFEKDSKKHRYIGEWHYHPNLNNYPSNQDLISLSAIASSKNYVVDEPIMLIFSRDQRLSCTVHPFDRKYYHTDCITAEEVSH